jgi:hypothetical protein
MPDISSSIDQMPPASNGSPLQKGRSEELTTNSADFCNKIDPKLTLVSKGSQLLAI